MAFAKLFVMTQSRHLNHSSQKDYVPDIEKIGAENRQNRDTAVITAVQSSRLDPVLNGPKPEAQAERQAINKR
jgi:hypothetical protein